MHRRRSLTTLAVIGCLLVLSAAACTPPPSSVTFTGHGYGHGRGMGQWGAYGYAVDHGWTWSQIVDHYYGGTTTSTLSTNPIQRVLMQANSGRNLIVVQEKGHFTTSAGRPSAGTRALHIRPLDNATFAVSEGPTCGGPWAAPTTVTAAELSVSPDVSNDDRTEMLQLCQATGQELVRGSLIAVHASSSIQTVNRIDTESMLRTVIAREMSPSWANAGGGRGLQALEAQAIAARSYMNSGDTRWLPIATTCDGGSCQAYSGVAHRASSTSAWTVYEDSRTDLAVAATAGIVRRFSNGKVAATEFAASSGGWSRGPYFTAVVDAGDSTAPNPNHNWSVTIPTSTIEAAFDSRQGHDVGSLQGVVVDRREGNGAEGGWVVTVRVQFSGGDVSLSGDQLRTTLGLKSAWFTPRSN